jgi:hypothetical protein
MKSDLESNCKRIRRQVSKFQGWKVSKVKDKGKKQAEA